MSRYYRSILNVQGAPALDPDAEAFLLAASITDATITDAIDTLVKSLKSNSIWTKMTALYPFVGGTASTHKFNLKNPVDSDAAFRLTFVGSPTHDANGLTFNGSSNYARTFVFQNTLNQNNNSWGLYSRTNRARNNQAIMGVGRSSPDVYSVLYLRVNFTTSSFALGNSGSTNNTSGATYAVVGSDDSTRYHMSNRLDSANISHFRQKTKGTAVVSSVTPSAFDYWIGGFNLNGALNSPDAINVAFAHTGEGLSDIEQGNFIDIINTFQTALTRNV